MKRTPRTYRLHIQAAISMLLLLAASGVVRGETQGGRFEDELAFRFERAVADVGVPGAVLLVRFSDGSVVRLATGVSKIKSQNLRPDPGDRPVDVFRPPTIEVRGEPLRTNSKFHVGSVKKTMVATLVLRLVQDGLLELDRPLSDWLPNLTPEFGRVTVRQCLNHTGGIADYVDHDDFYPALMMSPSKKWRPEELITFAGEMGPVGQPGERQHYANTNYILLDMAIRRATGFSADRLMTHRIVEPLGLRNTFFPEKAESVPGQAAGYRMETIEEPRWRDYTGFADPSWLGAAGAMVSTADDLSVWLRALMAGKFLEKEYRKMMFDWVPAEDPGEFAGLGVINRQGAVGHAGDYIFGYQACMYRRRGRDWIVLTNGTPARLDLLDGATEIFRQLAEGIE